MLLVNTGSNGTASAKNGLNTVASNEHETNGSSQYCPRHHHHTQQPQQRQTPSPNKRHRLTPRPHNIQRPCLDFEKMQQVKIKFEFSRGSKSNYENFEFSRNSLNSAKELTFCATKKLKTLKFSRGYIFEYEKLKI